MFGTMSAFTKQFTPVDGGYVYYPSRKSGGKLVTANEYEHLVHNWERVGATRGLLITSGFLIVAISLWTMLSITLALPESTNWIMVASCVLGLLAWTLRASLAPRRLVKDRPDIAPSRSLSEARRHTRAVLSWPIVILALLYCGIVCFGTLSDFRDRPSDWAWAIGSGFFFLAYLWITVAKLMDRYR